MAEVSEKSNKRNRIQLTIPDELNASYRACFAKADLLGIDVDLTRDFCRWLAAQLEQVERMIAEIEAKRALNRQKSVSATAAVVAPKAVAAPTAAMTGNNAKISTTATNITVPTNAPSRNPETVNVPKTVPPAPSDAVTMPPKEASHLPTANDSAAAKPTEVVPAPRQPDVVAPVAMPATAPVAVEEVTVEVNNGTV